MAFRPAEDGSEGGLTEQEQLESRVRQFHKDLNGHRRAPWWPNVPKAQVNLAVCETPRDHEFDEPVLVPLAKRAYKISVIVCKQCPANLTDVVVNKGGKG